MNLSSLRLATLLLVFALATQTAPGAEGPYRLLHSLFDPGTNTQAGTQQGYSVAVNGNIAVAGAPYDDTVGYHSGAVKVYDATTGALLHTLVNPNPVPQDYFGASVAISGTRVVVGGATEEKGVRAAGSAHVYDLAGATPNVPFVTLTNPSPATSNSFLVSVAVSGSRVVIVADSGNFGAESVRSAYVYDLAGASPTVPVTTLASPSPAKDDSFGSSVAIDGTRLVIGARRGNTGATDAGIAYVYDLASGTPSVPMATLTNPSPANGDSFGWAVAIDGITIAAGAPFDDTHAADRGAAYVFGLRPALNILPATPGFVTLSWAPADSPGFVLQSTESLAPADWVNVPIGAASSATISSTNAARFYRLVPP